MKLRMEEQKEDGRHGAVDNLFSTSKDETLLQE